MAASRATPNEVVIFPPYLRKMRNKEEAREPNRLAEDPEGVSRKVGIFLQETLKKSDQVITNLGIRRGIGTIIRDIRVASALHSER